MPTTLSRAHFRCRAAACAFAAVALTAAGCGGAAQKREEQKLEGKSILSKTAPLADRLIKSKEVQSASDAAGVRTFLRAWSLLQYEAWDEAVSLFEPGLRNLLSPALLVASLENDIAVWQATKPQIVKANVSGAIATISFLARNEQNAVVPTSVALGGSPGAWRIAYLPLLNPAIGRTQEMRVQSQVDPLATKPSPEAVRDAENASNVQAVYLERRLRAGVSAKP